MTAVAVDDPFLATVEPLRGELTAHCYRMLGSVHDAEDLVQETYIRAWRAYHGFENRSSVRTWMYQIATNVCLTALDKKKRRPLPTGLGQPKSDPNGALTSSPEVPWLEPLPDALVWGTRPSDPSADVVTRDSVRLAFVAALQHLTAQQRAVLILRDVLSWQASEVAATLGMTTAGVNSTLQRARAGVARMDHERDPKLPDGERSRELLGRYVEAFEAYDVSKIVDLLTADAVWEMPPFTGWYEGAGDIARLIKSQCPAQGPDDMRLVTTAANGQPVFAVYMRDPAGVHRAFQLQVLTLTVTGVSHVAAFFDTSLFGAFGLPETLSDSEGASGS